MYENEWNRKTKRQQRRRRRRRTNAKRVIRIRIRASFALNAAWNSQRKKRKRKKKIYKTDLLAFSCVSVWPMRDCAAKATFEIQWTEKRTNMSGFNDDCCDDRRTHNQKKINEIKALRFSSLLVLSACDFVVVAVVAIALNAETKCAHTIRCRCHWLLLIVVVFAFFLSFDSLVFTVFMRRYIINTSATATVIRINQQVTGRSIDSIVLLFELCVTRHRQWRLRQSNRWRWRHLLIPKRSNETRTHTQPTTTEWNQVWNWIESTGRRIDDESKPPQPTRSQAIPSEAHSKTNMWILITRKIDEVQANEMRITTFKLRSEFIPLKYAQFSIETKQNETEPNERDSALTYSCVISLCADDDEDSDRDEQRLPLSVVLLSFCFAAVFWVRWFS